MNANENIIQNAIRDTHALNPYTRTRTELVTLIATRTRAIRGALDHLTITALTAHAKANGITVPKRTLKDDLLDIIAAAHAATEGYATVLADRDADDAADALAAAYQGEHDALAAAQGADLLAEKAAEAAEEAEIAAAHVEAIALDYQWNQDAKEDAAHQNIMETGEAAKTAIIAFAAAITGATPLDGIEGWYGATIGTRRASFGPETCVFWLIVSAGDPTAEPIEICIADGDPTAFLDAINTWTTRAKFALGHE